MKDLTIYILYIALMVSVLINIYLYGSSSVSHDAAILWEEMYKREVDDRKKSDEFMFDCLQKSETLDNAQMCIFWSW